MWRIAAGVVAGLIGFLLAGELLFRALPVATATLTGYHIDPAILTYPPHHTWRTATGWDLRNAQTLRSNNLGFASDRDFVPDAQAVALIGDSFVEASMLSASDRPGPQLERLLGGNRAVYALGGPGSSLLDYAERIRYARGRLGVSRFVVLMEAGDIRQALCGSGNVHSACLDRKTLAPATQTQPEPSTLKRVLRHSALAQYVAGQLKADPQRLLREAFVRSAPAHPADGGATARRRPPKTLSASAMEMVDTVTDVFLARVAPYLQGAQLVIVVDGRRTGPRTPVTEVQLERDRFIERARAAGATVIDAEPLYARHAARSRLSLDVGPYDGHLNALGVGIVMGAAAGALK
jgi:hypothetical protein